MNPILFYIGNYPIYSYSFFILLALIVATIGVILQTRRQGIKMIDCIYLSMLAFIIGVIFAKLVSIIVHPYQFIDNFSKYGIWAIFSRKGFSFHGAIIGVFLAIYFFQKKVK